MHLQHERTSSGRISIVTLVGDHDLASNVLVRRALFQAVEDPLLVVDFQHCTLIDASILSSLHLAVRRASARGHRVRGINAQGVVARALVATHTDRALGFARTVSLAEEQEHLLTRPFGAVVPHRD